MHHVELDHLCVQSNFNLSKLLKLNPNINKDEASKRLSQLKEYKKQLDKLIKIPIVEQKSDEWYRMREEIVTASDFAQALGKGKFGSVKQFFQKKCEKTDSAAGSATNPFFKWGNMFEPIASDIYSDMRGLKVYNFGLIRHPRNLFFGASPDGINEIGQMVELKCPKKREIKFGDDVVEQYYYQIQGQLDVCDLDECDYLECAFDLCDSPEQFLNVCEDYDYYGILIEKPNNEYEYKIKENKDEMVKSAKESIGIKYYWVLKNYNLQRVYKDKDFLKKNLKLLEEVWNKVLYYRNNRKAYEIEVLKEIKIETQKYVCENSVPEVDLPKWSFIANQQTDY